MPEKLNSVCYTYSVFIKPLCLHPVKEYSFFTAGFMNLRFIKQRPVFLVFRIILICLWKERSTKYLPFGFSFARNVEMFRDFKTIFGD